MLLVNGILRVFEYFLVQEPLVLLPKRRALITFFCLSAYHVLWQIVLPILGHVAWIGAYS